MELRGLNERPNLSLGFAAPRLRRKTVPFSPGAMSTAAIVELWDLRERHNGLGVTSHQFRPRSNTRCLWIAMDWLMAKNE